MNRTKRARKNLFHALALVIGIAVASSPGNAQVGTIAGKVIAKGTRTPVDGAVVSIVEVNMRTVSLANGSFAMLGVPPGFYTLRAQRVGFATIEIARMEVRAGLTRTLDLEMRAGADGETDKTEADANFLDPAISTAMISMDREVVSTFPSLTLAGTFPIGGGYIDIPRSAATVSISDLRRGIVSQPSVRGGRSSATEYLLEGIAVSNAVFGASPLLIDPLAASSVSFSPGFVAPEYGGAMSGLVTQAIREGGARLEGGAEYYNSGLAGMFGGSSQVVGSSIARGYLAGPLGPKGLTFSLAGHATTERQAVVKLSQGEWQGLGGSGHSQGVGKVAYNPSPGLRFSLAGVFQQRSAITYDGGVSTSATAPPSVFETSDFAVARMEKRFSTANVSVSVANVGVDRSTCSVWQGVCVQDRFQRTPLLGEIPVGYNGPNTPYEATGQFFGGESYQSRVFRADAILQPTSHHQIRAGVYATRHDIEYADAIGYKWQGGVTLASRNVYRVKPMEASAYVQDAIEHDIFTLRIGARFDYANSGGIGWANTLDPTNGTNALDACRGQLPGLSETPFTYGQHSGANACYESPWNANGVPVLLDSAVRLAQRDDFRPVDSRVAVSPRIALSLPITESSGMYVNYGRFVRNPRYHDLFRYSGVGSRAGPAPSADGLCRPTRNLPGTNECAPLALLDRRLPEFIGNPNLGFERADAWEFGFTSRAGKSHTVDAAFFASNHNGLATLATTNLDPDPGLTYGLIAQNVFRTVEDRGSIATYGATITLRRQLRTSLSYILNYSWISSSEVGAHPDLLAEALVDTTTYDNSSEHATSRARPHAFNAQLTWLWRNESPPGLGKVGQVLLRNSRTVVTVALQSGSYSRTRSQPGCGLVDDVCAGAGRRVGGTGTLINAMYAKAITTGAPQWSLIARVQNLLDKDDGSAQFIRNPSSRANSGGVVGPVGGINNGNTPGGAVQHVSLRRILAGFSLVF